MNYSTFNEHDLLKA